MSDEREQTQRAEFEACPFCGATPVLRETVEHYSASPDGPAGSYVAWFHIACDSCGIELGDEYRSAAAEKWSRRTSPAPAVPTGWRLVPVEPTLDMSIAFAEVFYAKVRAVDDHDITDWWDAMLDAAPEFRGDASAPEAQPSSANPDAPESAGGIRKGAPDV